MGQLPPEPGSNATILPGFIVVLDQVTPVLAVLSIQGSLIFDVSRPDLHLILKVGFHCCAFAWHGLLRGLNVCSTGNFQLLAPIRSSFHCGRF